MRVRHPVYQVMDQTIWEAWIQYIQTTWPYNGQGCSTTTPTTTAVENIPTPTTRTTNAEPGTFDNDNAASDTLPTSTTSALNNNVQTPSANNNDKTKNVLAGPLIGVALIVATILLLIWWRFQIRNNYSNANNTATPHLNGLKMPSLLSSSQQQPYCNDPLSYQGGPPPAIAFQHHNVIWEKYIHTFIPHGGGNL